MKYTVRYLFYGVMICLVFFVFSPVMAAETDENARLKSLITELEKKIEDADKRMVAHPSFLEELRKLAVKYKSQLRELFFRDAFDDGDFVNNPKWMVRSGKFSITKSNRLVSFVAIQAVEPEKEPEQESSRSIESEAVGILIDSIFGSTRQNEAPENNHPPQRDTEPVKPARIYTKKVFPPAFELNMRFKSSESAEMEIVLLGTDKLVPWYRLKVKADHSQAEPMEVIRHSSSRNFTVGAADKFPKINDGKFHTLKWLRLTNGAMNVKIDGKTVLETYEVYYRDNFTGFELVNNGGSYEWDSFEIFKALKPVTK